MYQVKANLSGKEPMQVLISKNEDWSRTNDETRSNISPSQRGTNDVIIEKLDRQGQNPVKVDPLAMNCTRLIE